MSELGVMNQAEKEAFCKAWEEMRMMLLPKIDIVGDIKFGSVETEYYKVLQRKEGNAKQKIAFSDVTKNEWNHTCEMLRKLFRKKFSVKVWERAIDRAREVKR